MKLCLVLDRFEGDDIEQTAVAVANGLAVRGHDIHFALMQRGSPISVKLDKRVELYSLEKAKASFAVAGLGRFLDKLQPQAVISFGTPCNIAVLSSLALRATWKAPVVVVETQGFGGDGTRGLFSKALAVPLIYKEAARIVCAFEGIREDLLPVEWLASEKSCVIAPPYLAGSFLTSALQVEEYGPPLKPEEIVVLAPPTEQSTHRLFIEALAVGRYKRPLTGRILGEAGKLEPLQRFSNSLAMDDLMTFGPPAESQEAVFRDSAFYYEAQGPARASRHMVEAMAMGRGVISLASSVGVQELLTGVAGAALVPQKDAASLSGALINLAAYADEFVQLKQKARQFNVDVSLDQYEALILDVIRHQ
ncbi:hypothetical protein E1162_03630 [Rhodobacteraceae bacterium RKSG542]|uniref:hypothetical protein n=1 Tax=Pseudovibrio flavus TaxID=2529854 RepID=UPI0012BB8AD0|nr:hypothetical protein [Pseudovibrio flavus]MTI16328.1 hypothetical protein [Pseudovibrio flavus]